MLRYGGQSVRFLERMCTAPRKAGVLETLSVRRAEGFSLGTRLHNFWCNSQLMQSLSI